ncbi:hypothetical protein V492_03688 [Pseudogymnoascus sp. VKM F-4246]|nr:hypothetical protein V492_03688 [Pseudogymnoascus sp. VKM F-4246]
MGSDVVEQPNRIRFVATYNGPSRSKNQRTAAACNTCRKRKTRCDGERPVCRACRENGHECLGYATPRRTQAASDKAKSTKATVAERNVETEAPMRNTLDGTLTGVGVSTQEAFTHSSNASQGQRHAIDETLDPSQSSALSIPYFRYFGPSAIVPGYKQTVVRLKERGLSPDMSVPMPGSTTKSATTPPLEAKNDCLSAIQSAIYDPTNSDPVSPLIEHLVDTFFIRLGCNFPFLHRDRFMPMLREKKVEAILVHAICAVAARFSTHPLLTTAYSATDDDLDESKHPRSDYGHIFARRANYAVVDAFPCPTLASIQACLLLAYVSFGSNQDSALWLFLGCAIRMVQDLGLQKLKSAKYPSQDLDGTSTTTTATSISPQRDLGEGAQTTEILDTVEAEHTNTFWAVLMLDRVISSGTGRPVTLRDEDMDLPFPKYSLDPKSGWPLPFPALIRILHLYGRVTDLLNTIRDAQDVTPDMRRRLNEMESDLTNVYEGLDQRLTFNVFNFQHYVEAEQGANFVMVHFWFHTLIIILHQPTLLHSSEGSFQGLFPNSRELSMSSAKTIADILAFAELIDAKIFIGNPFTSQPIYVAACAFLMEMAVQTTSQPSSRQTTPPPQPDDTEKDRRSTLSSGVSRSDNHRSKKHSLLASAAKQNYQRCYKALQQLESYWVGIKYILTALDQKAEGVWDPEIYTAEEMESAKQDKTRASNPLNTRVQSPQGSAGPPRKKATTIETEQDLSIRAPDRQVLDAGQMWTLNGNTNSPSANLTFLYPNTTGELQRPNFTGKAISNTDKGAWGPIDSASDMNFGLVHHDSDTSGPSSTPQIRDPTGRASISEYLQPSTTGINASLNPRMFSQVQNQPTQLHMPMAQMDVDQTDLLATMPLENYHNSGGPSLYDFDLNIHGQDMNPTLRDPNDTLYTGMVGDMMVESQDIDMNPFPFGEEMFPWLEYIPQESWKAFDNTLSEPGGDPGNDVL